MPFTPTAHTEAEVRHWVNDALLPATRTTVAIISGVIVGFIAVSAEGSQAWIEQLYIHPDYVGQGVGSELLAHAVSTTRGHIRLYTFQQNERSCRFYEHRGFVAVEFTDGSTNEERCPDVLYQLAAAPPVV